MSDMVLNTPLSYRDNILYYSTGDTRAFVAQRSKPSTKMTLVSEPDSFVTHCYRTSEEKNI